MRHTRSDALPAQKKTSGFGGISLMLPLALFSFFFVLIPVIALVVISFLTRADGWGYEIVFTSDNYRQLLDPFYFTILYDSLKTACITTGICLLIGCPCGYALAAQSKTWQNTFIRILMLIFWIPGLVRLNGWVIFLRKNGTLESLLYGLGLIDHPLKLLYRFPVIVFGMVYALLPMMLLSVYSSAEKLDRSLLEASRCLGADRIRTFIHITLPMTLPGIMAGVVLTFVPSMGMFFIVEILGGNHTVLIGNIIQQQMTGGRNVPFACALAVLLLVLTGILLVTALRVPGERGDLFHA